MDYVRCHSQGSNLPMIACVLLVCFAASQQKLCAEIAIGDPIRFTRDAFLYENTTQNAAIITTVHEYEKAVVTNAFFYQRDLRTAYHPVNNPLVQWFTVRLERVPSISGSLPSEDAANVGDPVAVFDPPTGSFDNPTFDPYPCIIHSEDAITISIQPTLSHRISFGYATEVRLHGAGESWLPVGPPQVVTYLPGGSYLRIFSLPESLTSGATSVLLFDLRTSISFAGVELASREIGGVIIVLPPPPPPLELRDLHFNEFQDLIATLRGGQSSTSYWLESSTNLVNWQRRYSLQGTGVDQIVLLPTGNHTRLFFRVVSQ